MKKNELDTCYHASQLYKALSDETRLRIIAILKTKDMSVSELADSVNMASSAVSHQLKELRMAGLVNSRRSGQKIIYSMDVAHNYRTIAQINPFML